jgi:cytochrome P450
VRVVTADFEWHGKQIRQGDFMLLAVAAANRDPRVFDNPLKLDLSRRTDRVVTFGPGVHHCIGHLLAKMQMSEFFPAFFSRFNVEVLDKSLAFTPSLAFRGVETLHVRVASK